MPPRKKVKLKRKPIQAKTAVVSKQVNEFKEEVKTYSFKDVQSAVKSVSIESQPAYGSYGWAVAQSQKLLGLMGDAWCATTTARGIAYARPRYRIGLLSNTVDDSYEGGRRIIGSGATYIEALQEAYRRAMKLNICELDYVFPEKEDQL